MKNIKIDELAALVMSKLKEHGIDAVLVGGSCVSIYTNNKYQSYDLDLITYQSSRKVDVALNLLGFAKSEDRYYKNPDCPFFIEFVAPPVSIGEEKVEKYNFIDNKYGQIVLLTATDCVKDRLAAYFHWNDEQALEQAVMVARDNEVDIESIRNWSKKENMMEKFQDFINRIENSRRTT